MPWLWGRTQSKISQKHREREREREIEREREKEAIAFRLFLLVHIGIPVFLVAAGYLTAIASAIYGISNQNIEAGGGCSLVRLKIPRESK